jgi:2'-5' RNA ligase
MSQLSFFNNKKAEYFFLISPGKEGIEKVAYLKRLVQDLIGIPKEDLVSVPHITLFKIMLYEEDEQDFLTRCLAILASFQVSSVESMGVEFFEHPNASTHFVRVSESDLIQRIGRALYANFTEKKLHLNPHITVTKMSPQNQHDAIQEILHTNYKPFSFLLDRVLVLKKTSAAKKYFVLRELKLGAVL